MLSVERLRAAGTTTLLSSRPKLRLNRIGVVASPCWICGEESADVQAKELNSPQTVMASWRGPATTALSVLGAAWAVAAWWRVAMAREFPLDAPSSPPWLWAALVGHFLALAIISGHRWSAPLSTTFVGLVRCTTLGLIAVCVWQWLRQSTVVPWVLGGLALQGLLWGLAELRPLRRSSRGSDRQSVWLWYGVTVALMVTGSAAADRARTLNAPQITGFASAPIPANRPAMANDATAAAPPADQIAEASQVAEVTPLAETVWNAEAATVRVVNRSGGMWGTGTIVAAVPGAAYVLTASHLVAADEETVIERGFRSGLPAVAPWDVGDGRGVAELVLQDVKNDLALLRVPLRQGAPPPATLSVCPLREAPATAEVEVLVVSSNEHGLAQSAADTVVAKRIRRRAGAAILTVWEGTYRGHAGASGGAVVDRHGRLIGVRSGIGDGKPYYCHLASVHGLLDRWDSPTREAPDTEARFPPDG